MKDRLRWIKDKPDALVYSKGIIEEGEAMRAADQVADFVAKALANGRSRDEIAGALLAAGWTQGEVSAGLDAWAVSDFTPPVPRPRPYFSAKEAFVYGIMFTALAMTTYYITALGFELIDRWLPEPGADPSNYGLWNIRWSVATLIVTLPVFAVLNLRMARAVRREPSKRRSALRKWFGYVTLFLAAVALAGDLIATIYAFLSGELTLNFSARAGLVALTAGLVFGYFMAEMGDGDDAR